VSLALLKFRSKISRIQVCDTEGEEGTLGLMTKFYKQLGDEKVRIKAEALRQALLAMIQGTIVRYWT
jgi:hypothetical protein